MLIFICSFEIKKETRALIKSGVEKTTLEQKNILDNKEINSKKPEDSESNRNQKLKMGIIIIVIIFLLVEYWKKYFNFFFI